MATNNFSVELRGLKEMRDKFGESNKVLNGQLQIAMNNSTIRLKSEIRKELTEQKISNQGSLRTSVNVIESKPFKGVVGVGEKYGLYVEKGTRPHMPPVGPLERWAQTKLGKKGLGFIIAKKIAREGTKAKPFVEPAFSKNKQYIYRQFQYRIAKFLKLISNS